METSSQHPTTLNLPLSILPILPIISTISTLLLPLVALVYVQHDYKRFLSLGPGGTPSTPLGYLKIKLLSLISLRDPLRPLPIPPHFRPQRGYLSTDALPSRSGTRPVVQGIAPQRQRTQRSSAEVYAELVASLRALTHDPQNCVVERTSCFEKHSSGLFASTPITRTCGGEVCHAHPSDGSLHMTLHPADAQIVLENKWGERHPLARGGWFRRFVPREFVLIYAPRREEEIEVVLKVVAAAVWWVSGIDVEREGEGERKDRGLDTQAFVRARAKADTECGTCRLPKGMEQMVGDA
ncbi:hypothetical protein K504DRAFT_461314 [Pleomassaria siparia CBS 279.74]|uniref:Luciferase domain-containing protein n=1 Tax=Pleomassaria siparia CBS 279.74 TaxID=1314801 RepID=A0A6G1JWF8_9PLEO|nr:hypothetical protein K504DRAFT_461314 [Pleomassaria siparia CBS 279.74]